MTHLAFGSVGSPPNYVDLDGNRRPGTRAAFQDLLKLCQVMNSVHFVGGYPVEPIDAHPSVRHLHAAFDVLTLTDKSLHTYSLGRQRNRDVLELARIARSVDDATLEREPSVFTVVNSSSPLRIDHPMLQGIIELSSHNQVVVMTPFTLAGAMAPVTLAGAVALQNAEALAGMVFTQVVRPGAPVVYGGFTSNVDMQSGSPAFGTPEYVRTAMLGGQLARRYRVPYRSSNVCAANALDAQAAYESVFSLWGAVMGGVNFLMHGAGWMEGGLHASAAKLVLDADLLAMVASLLDPIVVDDDTLGAGRHRRGRARRSLLRRRPHPGALPHRVLPADDLRLAQLRDLGRGRAARGGRPCRGAGPPLPRRLRAAAHGAGRAGGARELRCPPRRRGRRSDGLLSGEAAEQGDSVKSSAQVVVIGGGVVGASVLYHLTKAGWTDVVLVERRELTSGSTWHAAGGMHTLNGDPNVSKLQQYTIELYKEIEAASGQDCSIHLPGGLMLADTRERLDWLRMAQARGRYLGMELEIITAAEAKDVFPLMEDQYFVGALFDPVEGHVDPTGVTNAYAMCARKAGAEVERHTMVTDLRQRRRRDLGRHHRPRGDPRRAHRQRRRAVGPRGRAHGRHRAAGAGHGAHVPRHRADGRGRGPQRPHRPRDAHGPRLRR